MYAYESPEFEPKFMFYWLYSCSECFESRFYWSYHSNICTYKCVYVEGRFAFVTSWLSFHILIVIIIIIAKWEWSEKDIIKHVTIQRRRD